MAAKPPTAAQRRYWTLILTLGCCVGPIGCSGRFTIHHCFTGGGGRKNHSLVIPLCWEHHLGKNGIDGKRLSKREWQKKFGSEQSLIDRVQRSFIPPNSKEKLT